MVLLALPAAASAGRMPRPPVLRVSADRCPDAGGPCASSSTIYVDGSSDRFIRAHEIGHLFDAQLLTDSDRAWFMRAMHLPGPWVQGSGWPDGAASPSEWFADYYAACDTGINPNREWVASYAPQLNYGRLARLCWAIAAVGVVRGAITSG